MRQLTVSFFFLYCLVLVNILFSQSTQAENKNTIELNSTDKSNKNLSELYKKTANVPLFLFLMDFSQLDQNAIEQTKQELQKKQQIKLKYELDLNPFHQRNSLTLKEKMAVSEQSFCRICHLPLPHQKNIRSRTFNNMHSRYIACETCHLDQNKLNKLLFNEQQNIQYHWFDFNSRTQIDPLNNNLKSQPETIKKQDFNQLASTAKITPFYKKQAAVITRQHLYAKKLQVNWDASDQQSKAEIKLRTHQYIKADGESCQNCHSKNNGLLDLSALGATDQQLLSYKENSIVNFFKRYKDTSDENTVNSSEKPQQQVETQRIRITDLLP